MEVQIIGAALIIAVMAVIGYGAYSKRRWGENAPGAKYSKKGKGV